MSVRVMTSERKWMPV